MGRTTKNLQLVKPVSGHNNWGEAINQNWEKIDKQYGVLSANLNSFEERLGEMGIFNFWYNGNAAPDNFSSIACINEGKFSKDMIYVKIINNTSLAIGYITDSSTSTNPDDIANPGSTGKTKFQSVWTITTDEDKADTIHVSAIPTYTAFYIYEVSGGTTFNDRVFSPGDVMVFVQVIQDNITKYDVRRMTQAIGCTYALDQRDPANTNIFYGQKIINPGASNHIRFYVPQVLTYGQQQFFNFTITNEGGSYEYDTEVAATITVENKVLFGTGKITVTQYIGDIYFTDLAGNKCMCDHIIIPPGSNSGYKIKIQNCVGINSGTSLKCYYTIYQTLNPNI